MDYDVVVVGAGPAGASAAYWLGEAGQRVLVLERAGLPRYKACGGGVPTVVFNRFPSWTHTQGLFHKYFQSLKY